MTTIKKIKDLKTNGKCYLKQGKEDFSEKRIFE